MKKAEATVVESTEPMSLEEARAFVRTITEEDRYRCGTQRKGMNTDGLP
jgi:hypothetical protein